MWEFENLNDSVTFQISQAANTGFYIKHYDTATSTDKFYAKFESNNFGVERVELLYGGSKKFETTASGATITGDLEVTGSTTSTSSAKAWINFDGRFTDGIRNDFNLSSFTDNGTGQYTFSFDNNMSNANYCVVSSGHYIKDNSQSGNTGNAREMGAYILTTSSFKLVVSYNGSTMQDAANIFCAVFGD